MALDLVNQLTNELRGGVLNEVASAIGESPAKTQIAAEGLMPALISGLAGKALTQEGANAILDRIQRENLASVSLEDVSSGSVAALLDTGRPLVDMALGNKANSILDWVSSYSGIARSAAVRLAGLLAPAILGAIGRRLGSGGMTTTGLSGVLGDPSTYLENAPAGLTRAFGFDSAAAGARHVLGDAARRTERASAHAREPASSGRKWIAPLLLLVGAIAVFSYLLSRRHEPTTATLREPVAGLGGPAADSAAALGDFVNRRLPDGMNLRIPANGAESNLLAFITDPSRTVDTDTWFTLDRLYFEPDTVDLEPASSEQLDNIAAILKAYPQVTVKIGAYTDNTGDPAHSLELSQERATNTLTQLVNRGISRSRLSAEGFGQEFPIADNSTADGRQRNRRVDISVTSK